MREKLFILKEQTLIDIANAIRTKTGTNELIKIQNLDDAIAVIQGGGGNDDVATKLMEEY
jgi:hypothetical protein